jgi:DNA-binding transcriptional LysR family regulator
MDLDQLHTFLEIVRLKSFSKAAQTCYRTQPAISAQVRQLEQELNTTLFERLGTKISLTVAGRIFAEHAEQILALRCRDKARAGAAGGGSGELLRVHGSG